MGGSSTAPKIAVRDRTPDDQAWIEALLARSWGGTRVVSRGALHDASALPALVAERDGERAGLLTYCVSGTSCEVVTLDAQPPRGGVGTALIEACAARARALGCRRIWLITSNDNLDALRFYQRRGFRLVAVHVGAIDEARRLKPSISEVGEHGIPIHDEIELEMLLGSTEAAAMVQIRLEIPAHLADFAFPEALDRRLHMLLDEQDRREGLTEDEQREAEALVDVSELLTLLRLRASV
jgi:GNAT superfamily N-acetyltransferase